MIDLKKLKTDWKDLTKKEEVAGLDVGSSCVKLVQLKTGVGGYVASAACKADTGVNENDDEKARTAKTVIAIKKCFEASKLESKQMVCGICGPEVAVRPFSFPALLPAEEMYQAIMLEAEQVCPFDPAKNILEYQLISDSGLGARGSGNEEQATSSDMRGVLVAATNEVVRSRQQLISNASLNCALLDIDGLALVNCFEKTNGMRDVHSACILNIGHTFTTLVIMEEKKPPFIRDILQGGSQLIEHVAAERNLTREAAARAVIGPSDGQLSDVLASGAVKLIGEINETLRYYIREQRLQAIDKVYVCGGFSLVDGFVDILSRQIIFGATLWNPFEHIGKQPEATGLEILDKAGPAFAVAAGLAMRTI